MIHIERLVRKIKDALASAGGNAPVSILADEFATVTRDLNRRLNTCESVIAEGSEYQAIQMAETPPSLLDAVSILSFPEYEGWTAYCAEQGLTEPEPLNESAVKRLNAIYAKGIDRNHPLYREYRQCIRSKDNRKAFEVVSAIVKLNPADKDSLAERNRLRQAVFREIEADLLKALASEDRVQVAALVDALAEHGVSGDLDLSSSGAMQQAIAQLELWRRADAENELDALIDHLRADGVAEDFSTMSQVVERADLIVAEFGIAAGGDRSELLEKHRKEVRAVRAENAERSRFQSELQMLDAAVTAIENMPVERLPDPRQMRDIRVRLEKQWMAVESFRRAVPPALQERAEHAAARLDSRVDQLDSRKRLTLIGSFTAAAIVVIAASVFCYLFWSARQYEERIIQLSEKNEIDQASLVGEDAASRPLIASLFPFLSGAIAEARQAMEHESARREAVVAQIEDLQSKSMDAFADMPFPDVSREMGELTANLAATTTAFQAAQAASVEPVQAQYTKRITIENDNLRGSLARALESAETEILEHINSSPVPKATNTSAPSIVSKALETLDAAITSAPGTEITPGEAQQVRIERIRSKAAEFLSESEKFTAAKSALENAQSFDEYREALSQLSATSFAEAEEIGLGARVLATVDSSDHFARMLLMPDVSDAWSVEKVNAPHLPDSVSTAELQLMLALREDPMLSQIYSEEVIDHNQRGQRRRVFSKSKPVPPSVRNAGTIEFKTWGGEFYDPQSDGDSPKFPKRIYQAEKADGKLSGQGLVGDVGLALSPESQALQSMSIERVFNDLGTKYTQHLFVLVDRVLNMQDLSPVFRAYILQQCADVISIRPDAWGLVFSPTASATIDALRKATSTQRIRAGDWMAIPPTDQRWKTLNEIFSKSTGARTLDEVKVNRAALKKALEAGVNFAGFVSLDGKVVLTNPKASAYSLWAMKSENRVIRVTPDDIDGAMALSPVFYVPIRPDETLRQVASTQSVVASKNLAFVSPLFRETGASASEITAP